MEQVTDDSNFGMAPSSPPNGKGLPNPEHELYDVCSTMEHNPPEGRDLFFEDGIRRIDYMLVWSRKSAKPADQQEDDQLSRNIFERNLQLEGLQLEFDYRQNIEYQYVKIHAPFEVLSRMAEMLKIRMPMKEVPEEYATSNLWEFFTSVLQRFLQLFQVDRDEMPPMPKKFTCIFDRTKPYLFAIPQRNDLFFTHATRSRIVEYLLRKKEYGENSDDHFSVGITRLIAKRIYIAAYPLHEGSWKLESRTSMRNLLYKHWASWRNVLKLQPHDYIRIYFGEKIGMYFAWLGFYTLMLIPASFVGLVVFLFGLGTISSDIVGIETCNDGLNLTMCPPCDLRCSYYNIAASCDHVRASHLFDNGATVFFAMFMSLWGTLFLEFWKRKQAVIQFQWNLLSFEEEEEQPRPEYLANLQSSKHKEHNRITGELEPFQPFWGVRVPIMMTSVVSMLFMAMVALAVVIGVIICRISVIHSLYQQKEELLYKNATIVSTASAACINLVCIVLLNYVYRWVAVKLTDWECLRTQSVYENSLTIKLYILNFVNYYSSIFYIAFFKGRFLGRPGSYNTFFGARQEECEAGGCLIELALQLAIIFIGKQLIQNNLMEILLPRIQHFFVRCLRSKESRTNYSPWEKDLALVELGSQGLFNEYLEMLLQFGFVTIFVAAFPLAPLFAFINNIIEIRADANKLVTQMRRPMAARAQNIGIWYGVLYGVSRLSILTNGLIIAFTSGFIERLVYTWQHSADGTLSGFVNHSLSYFDVKDFTNETTFYDPEHKFNGTVRFCRYRDYREPPWSKKNYQHTAEYWNILAIKFLFVCIFENIIVILTSMISYLIPDMPKKLREQVRREAYLTNEIKLKTELAKARGEQTTPADLKRFRLRFRAQSEYQTSMEVTPTKLC